MAEPQPPEAPTNGAATIAGETFVPGSKRQRRPSVRLGDIGEQPAAITSEPHLRRGKQWKISSSLVGDHPRHPLPSKDPWKPTSKTRPLTILGPDDPRDAPDLPLPSSSSGAAGAAEDRVVLPVDEIPEPVAVAVAIRRGIRDAKARRAVARRVRSAWTSKVDEGTDGADMKSSGGEDAGEEGYREFDDLRGGDSECTRAAAGARVRVSDSRDIGPASDAVEGDLPSETDGGDWDNQNGRCGSYEDGEVRSWLNRLGLGRYAPVFEIHEVDDEVLPYLTLEDLKDMGINAVGSRRKMFCAIQKLQKGFL
ncbi:ankyrin repeat and SAM domain-containing protein 6-like isoform X1 [Phoenix dactylifera]|nr:ankyrin repeat and SAM domain-containing protein 6-like isoform X1 [Phoenix dactylifera]